MQVVFRETLQVCKLFDRGLLELRELCVRHGKHFVAEQQPEAVTGYVGDCSRQSDDSTNL